MCALAVTLLLLCLVAPVSAQTRLYLHATTSSIAGYKDMTVSLGAGVVTLVTNTAAGGTDIQVTNTAGGTAQAWISPALVTGFTLSGTVTCNVYGGESATTANVAFRCRLYKYSGGAEGAAILTANMTTELNTSLTTVRNWTGTPTSTAFAAGDRLVLKLFLENCATSGCPTGTMAGSQTATIRYDGVTVGADGATWVQATQTLDFGSDITSNLVVLWALETGSGTTATDGSGTGNDGTFQGGPAWTTGKVGTGGITLNSGDDYVQRMTGGSLPAGATAAFTIAGWVKLASFINLAHVFGFGENPPDVATDGAQRGILTFNPGAGDNYYFWGANADWDTGIAVDIDNAWHHIAFTASASALTFYRDGTQRATTSRPAGLTTAATTITLGSNNGAGTPMLGTFDDVRVYARELNSSDIAALFTLGTGAAAAAPRHRAVIY
jgi:hypothetical protein